MQGHQWELHMAVRVLQEFGIWRAFPPFYQEISKVFTLGYQAFTECYPEKEYITIAAFSYLRKACLKSITCYVSIWTCGTFELTKEFTSLLYHERGTYILEFHRRDKRVVCRRLKSTCKISGVSAKYIQVIGICLCLCSYLYCLHVSAYMVSLVQTYLHGEKLMK